MITLSVVLIISMTLFIVVDTRFIGLGWVGDAGGLYYISDIYTPNNNVSYEVFFHGVNFTFMHWIDDPFDPEGEPLTAYFLIEFPDNMSEVINILTGSWDLTHGRYTLPLTAETTINRSPIAGVLYHGYMDSPVGWKFIVSVL